MIIRPPERPQIANKDFVLFLAGPIQGTLDWQSQAIDYLSKSFLKGFNYSINESNFHIASPRRLTADTEFRAKKYYEQIDWEIYWLNRAATNGVILFWLANEYEHDCKRAFAQTTRFELSEWKCKYDRGLTEIAIGIDKDFSGHRYIAYRFLKDCPEVLIHDTLEQTCDDAFSYYLPF
jgi:hypothetical protein